MRIELSSIFNKLGAVSRVSLESAASLCVERGNKEVTIIHLLYALMDAPLSDFRIMLKQLDLDVDEVKQKLAVFLPQDQGLETYPVFSPLLMDIFQETWLLSSTELGQPYIRSGAIFLVTLLGIERYLPFELIGYFKFINREQYRNNFSKLLNESAEEPLVDEQKDNNPQNAVLTGQSFLDKYTVNYTQDAEQGLLDPVLSRNEEINLMIDILCRRRKNNPIVVGDAGVGKSALIEGLAQKIVNKEVPDKLLGVRLLALDLGLLQAGASVKGEFEKRLKGIIDEVRNATIPTIVFIDEAHTMIGAGNQEGGGDAANLLKPALARGDFRTIAATTWKEYKKYFEKDPALSRRFQLVSLKEPTVDQTINILRGLLSAYEISHQVLITDDAVRAASALSHRYISGRQLPDKAIDVLDTACARIAINMNVPPLAVSALNDELYQLHLERQLIERELKIGNYDQQIILDELNEKETELQQQFHELSEEWKRQNALIKDIIQLRSQILEQKEERAENSLEDNLESNVRLKEADFASSSEKETDSSAEQAEDETGDNEWFRELSQEALPENALANEAGEAVLPEDQEPSLIEQLKEKEALLEQIPLHELLVHSLVDEKQIAAVISDWTGIPINQMDRDELEKITDMPTFLSESIKGQSLAIQKIHRYMLTSRADLRRVGRPKGSFLLVGPSGVGKTETVIQIADLLYGGKQFLTVINMSEYQEKHTVSRLIGSPPGYIGFGEGGVLTEAIRKNPYSIVLLDEVEKAHPEVLNIFYQAFDKGEVADGEGRVIDCQNIIFFLTSNLGYQTIVDYYDVPIILDEKLYPELSQFFKPALLARMEVVPYLPLNDDTLRDIIRYKLSSLEALLLERYKSEVIISDELIDEIKKRATRTENGARMLESIIDGQLLPPLSLELLNRIATQQEISKIHLSVNDEDFHCYVE